MTPQIERELDTWKKTGVYPFPNLGLERQPSPTRYSPTDLRLIHHISSIASQMRAVEPGNSAIWTKRVPMLVAMRTRPCPTLPPASLFPRSHASCGGLSRQ